MIPGLLVILGCQLVGEIVSHGLHLPIPGPVLGMLLLVAGLSLSPPLVALVRPVVKGILDNLLLLFVPAGVGAGVQLVGMGMQIPLVLLAVVVSTVLAIAAGALTFALVARVTGNSDDEAVVPQGKGGRP